jgi:hypothetical protein
MTIPTRSEEMWGDLLSHIFNRMVDNHSFPD